MNTVLNLLNEIIVFWFDEKRHQKRIHDSKQGERNAAKIKEAAFIAEAKRSVMK